VSRYQKGKTNLDFTEARDSEWQWQWHQLGHMQICTLLQTENHASTPPLSFLQAGCPSCRPTNSVKALEATHSINDSQKIEPVQRPVVHENVRFPHERRRNANVLDASVFALVPRQTVVVPLLQAQVGVL